MKTFATTPFDWFNLVAQDYNSNALIQFVLKTDKWLDFNLLTRALLNCLIADPVLGCRFLVENGVPQWVTVDQKVSQLCVKITDGDVDRAVKICLSEPLDARCKCPVKLFLVESDVDARLVVKVHHAVCDAGGALQFVRMLAEMYTRVEANPNFRSEPCEPCRGTDGFYKHFGVTDKPSRFNPSLLPEMQCTWGTPYNDVDSCQSFSCQTVKFIEKQVDAIKTFAKVHGSSLNAVVTSAYHRALVLLLNPAEDRKEVQFSASLRNYLEEDTNTVCNLSNMYNVTLPTRCSFEELVGLAKNEIDKAISPELVLQGVIACELMSSDFNALDSFYASDWETVKLTGNCTPMISNVGRLDNKPICFGRCDVTDMMLVSPAFVSPSFMLSVSSYRNVMTLCVAYQKPSMDDGFVTSLLEEMKEILTKI